MKRAEFLELLEHLAPLSLAASWDNVGLIVDGGERPLAKVLLCIDLNGRVFSEAQAAQVDLVIAYHPPIFSGLKRLHPGDDAAGVAVRCLSAGVSVYSPHTALDAAPGCMGDWLACSLGAGSSRPIVEEVLSERPDLVGAGSGRVVRYAEKKSLQAALAQLKEFLGLAHLRVAAPVAPEEFEFASAAFCPGAGGSVFESVSDSAVGSAVESAEGVELFVTGEMRHHDVLAYLARGQAVVLTEHSNCERGYLKEYREQLQLLAPSIEFLVSESDADPLCIY